jgi:hypothetical protein
MTCYFLPFFTFCLPHALLYADIAIATACFCDLPAFFSALMFCGIAALSQLLFSGILVTPHANWRDHTGVTLVGISAFVVMEAWTIQVTPSTEVIVGHAMPQVEIFAVSHVL